MSRRFDLPDRARVTVASDHGSMDLVALEPVYAPGNGRARGGREAEPPLALSGFDADGRLIVFNWAHVEGVVELLDSDLENSPLSKKRDTMTSEPTRLHVARTEEDDDATE